MNYNFVVMETFGKWLLRHRKALDLKQGEVAARAQVSVSYISTLEREQPHSTSGEEIKPDRDKIARIAKAVGGNVNEALRLTGYAPKEDFNYPQTYEELMEVLKKYGICSLGLTEERMNKIDPEYYKSIIQHMENSIKGQLQRIEEEEIHTSES